MRVISQNLLSGTVAIKESITEENDEIRKR